MNIAMGRRLVAMTKQGLAASPTIHIAPRVCPFCQQPIQRVSQLVAADTLNGRCAAVVHWRAPSVHREAAHHLVAQQCHTLIGSPSPAIRSPGSASAVPVTGGEGLNWYRSAAQNAVGEMAGNCVARFH
eukprot:gnl/MRDRNA2_/MRDRNA2_74897_c0_seq2.p1 gnl/MRDRNA2_/MRDRNA2_74897_c0~~gnl/MRDRNA2_/MRDRNA2_74897_c0_seq2.p1  ORF type:complete len:129 (-),score=17.88 gnl/MRDRNA2_/MRDRNA2_74897_c0_seq2:28-414(-)